MAEYLINGQTPEALGVTVASRNLRNQGPDMVTLQMVVAEGVSATLPLVYDQEVTITKDGVGWFAGRVLTPVVSGQAGNHGTRIDIVGPWNMLKRLTYTELTAPEGGEKTSRYVWNLSGAVRQTTQEALTQVLDYAVAKGAGFEVAPFTLDEVKPPKATKLDRKCDELVTASLQWHPDVAVWFDYTTTPPTMHLTKRGEEGAVATFDLTSDTDDVEECTPIARPDLTPSGVVIRYERGGVTLSADNGTRPAVAVDVCPPGSEADALDAMVQTVTLSKGDIPIMGLAQRTYEAYATLVWEGGMRVVEEDCDTGLHPGMSVQILGGKEDWETMQAFIQGVVENVRTGSTAVEFGLPQYCGYQPKMAHLSRQRTNDTVKDNDAAGAERLEAVAPPEPPSTALTGWVEISPSEVVLRVSDGVISNGDPEEDDVTPLWDSSGTALNAVPPPGLVLSEGDAGDFYLYLELTPDTEQFTVLDADGDPITEWRMTSGATVEEARIKFSTGSPSGRKAVINSSTGDVTQTARVYYRWGSYSWPVGGEPTASPARTGSMTVLFVPPNRVIATANNG